MPILHPYSPEFLDSSMESVLLEIDHSISLLFRSTCSSLSDDCCRLKEEGFSTELKVEIPESAETTTFQN